MYPTLSLLWNFAISGFVFSHRSEALWSCASLKNHVPTFFWSKENEMWVILFPPLFGSFTYSLTVSLRLVSVHHLIFSLKTRHIVHSGLPYLILSGNLLSILSIHVYIPLMWHEKEKKKKKRNKVSHYQRLKNVLLKEFLQEGIKINFFHYCTIIPEQVVRGLGELPEP